MRSGILLLLLSFTILAAGCSREPELKVTANYMANTASPEERLKTLEGYRADLQRAYQTEARDKDSESANSIAVTLLQSLQQQNILKEMGVQFTPVGTKVEALSWIDLAISRSSVPPRNSLPGHYDAAAKRKELEDRRNVIRANQDLAAGK